MGSVELEDTLLSTIVEGPVLRVLLMLLENIDDTELDKVVAADLVKLEDSEDLKGSVKPKMVFVVVGRLELELILIGERVLVVPLASMVVVENDSVLDELTMLVVPSIVV